MLCLFMSLSKNAIKDLRIEITKHFGEEFERTLTDEQVNEIGLCLLVPIVEDLKIKVLQR